jgi:gas vesicle protein
MSNSTGNSVLAILLGAAIGAGIGILFAPDKGSKTRKKIKEEFDEAKDNLKHKLEDVSNEVKSKFSTASENWEDTLENVISDVSYKTEDVISFLETKLADLKAKNATLQKKENI